jgi:hypothetical protein
VTLNLAYVAAEHLRDQFELVYLGHSGALHRASIPHDRDPVTDLVKLIKLMRHEQHRYPIGPQLPDDTEQYLDLLFI